MAPKLKLLTGAARTLGRHGVRPWSWRSIKSRLDRPIASIVFDDFAQSAWTVGGNILESVGARGTYFVAGSCCGRECDGVKFYGAEELLAAHRNGHEIGGHTFALQGLSSLSAEEVEADLERNNAFVRGLLGDVRLTSFAYPHGETSARARRLCSRHFAACRGREPGVNAGWIDLSQLKALPLGAHSLDSVIESAHSNRGWIIFVGHDVSDNHSPRGCTPQTLASALSRLRAANIELLPMKNALGRLAFGR